MNFGYEFKDKKLLKCAFTHISYANEHNIESNQRLEFLGDSVLSFVVATKLYEIYPGYDEGKLTEMRAALVCEKSLSKKAEEMGLSEEIVFGRSESRSNGRRKASILCDTFEALLGAIYLDGGIAEAEKWVLSVFSGDFENVKCVDLRNYKSELQSYYQKKEKKRGLIEYRLDAKTGPDHNPEFKVSVYVNGAFMGKGSGKNLKSAEQLAAKLALDKTMGKVDKNAKI
ncbi:MAG: ribonuclease III [Ruminococcaceae bacterium]|nr:ribonuclease III [Oscillospiraceae bacterium]